MVKVKFLEIKNKKTLMKPLKVAKAMIFTKVATANLNRLEKEMTSM